MYKMKPHELRFKIELAQSIYDQSCNSTSPTMTKLEEQAGAIIMAVNNGFYEEAESMPLDSPLLAPAASSESHKD
ncbi:hypothetical protein ACI2KR_06685 [Pseudomonas luteola]